MHITGYEIYTTLIKGMSRRLPNKVYAKGMDYDRRHGYRGAESFVDMKDISDQDESLTMRCTTFDIDDLSGTCTQRRPKLIKALSQRQSRPHATL